MLVGTGIDLTEIPRIQKSIARFGNRFLDRIFTPREKAYCLRKRNAAESFAARFAAKEAAAKALGTGISYRPGLAFHGRAAQTASRLGVTHAALSLTHTEILAMASVSLEST
jgi:holo-[acyl-carrier protein] synthase